MKDFVKKIFGRNGSKTPTENEDVVFVEVYRVEREGVCFTLKYRTAEFDKETAALYSPMYVVSIEDEEGTEIEVPLRYGEFKEIRDSVNVLEESDMRYMAQIRQHLCTMDLTPNEEVRGYG